MFRGLALLVSVVVFVHSGLAALVQSLVWA